MTQASDTFTTRCPHCSKAFVVRQAMAGKTAKCSACGQPFAVVAETETAFERPGSRPPPMPASVTAALCPVCQAPLMPSEPKTSCPQCKSVHHKDCWEYNRGCGLYGCSQAPETEKLETTEIPASYWGQTEKRCPGCGQSIQAAAIRCRHCGVVFETARPQGHAEYWQSRQTQGELGTMRTVAILLTIAAAIPCTAPLAAVFGLIWYFSKRKTIAALPSTQVGLYRIAIGLACGVTVLLVVIMVLYSLFHTP